MKILLEAPILTKSGYGEHSRLVYRAIKMRKDIDLYLNPLNWGTTTWSTPNDEMQKDIDNYINLIKQYNSEKINPQFDMQVHVGIPNEFV